MKDCLKVKIYCPQKCLLDIVDSFEHFTDEDDAGLFVAVYCNRIVSGKNYLDLIQRDGEVIIIDKRLFMDYTAIVETDRIRRIFK